MHSLLIQYYELLEDKYKIKKTGTQNLLCRFSLIL